ncbi:MAG: hypothetical protein COA79_01600 [Planctomycetota bacterium]|nr:MAG: hypothetical protein COA79_01600 [Planctomycetota bacterium]
MSDHSESNLLKHGCYVVLKHSIHNDYHFDLILEGDPLCPTYQSSASDLTDLTRIKDHREKYLNFEGLISPEKGSVVVVEKGKYELIEVQKILLVSSNDISRSLRL